MHNDDDILKVSSDIAKGIDEYEIYHRIVKDDDHGKLFTPAQYEAYKKRVFPMRINNRIFVSWVNSKDTDCILIGPETECFCSHRYYQHKTDFELIPNERPIPQPCSKCNCKSYHLKPKFGSTVVRCHCKHESDDHNILSPFKCKRTNCKCEGFKTSMTCDCGYPAFEHKTVSETKEEREARGHPIGKPTPYQAMGGITGFSSLLPGIARMDPSGTARTSLTSAELDASINDNDHPFLRMMKSTVEKYEDINSTNESPKEPLRGPHGRGQPFQGQRRLDESK